MESAKILLFLILTLNFKFNSAEQNKLLNKLENKLEIKIGELVSYVTKWLENYNDRNLGDSDIGRLLRYNNLKPKFEVTAREGKNIKKMSMALLPLVFHVGATSTWMLLTSIMAAKSVLIGLALLVFKIAVSSAKVASFFTTLKSKTGHGHHEHDWSWNPHSEHGHYRSLNYAVHPTLDWNSYSPEVIHSEVHPYKTIPSYKSNEHDSSPFEDGPPSYSDVQKKRRS